jgi:hypothetical protein
MELLKYPRTQHIEGSRLQPGDEDLDSVPLAQIAGRHVVIAEKSGDAPQKKRSGQKTIPREPWYSMWQAGTH